MRSIVFSRASASNSFAAWSRGGRGRVRALDEGSEQLELLSVAAVRSREFQDRGNFAEALVIHQKLERLFAEFSLSDVFVAVHPRTQVALRVVEVKRPDPRASDRLVHGADKFLIARGGPEIVARVEGVAGIDAHADPLRMGGSLDD